jgi:hypothetical protein
MEAGNIKYWKTVDKPFPAAVSGMPVVLLISWPTFVRII